MEEEFEDESKMFAIGGGKWYKVEEEDGLPTVYFLGTRKNIAESGGAYFDTPPVVVNTEDITPEMEREIRRIWRGI